MKPTISQLNSPDRYALIESIRIDEMNAFVARELGLSARKGTTERPKRGWAGVLVIVFLAAIGGLAGYELATLVMQGNADSVAGALVQAGLGLAGFLGLLPLHELIHGLVFKRVGAERVGYGGSLKGLMVYAYAQNLVMTLRELALVAVMPFVVITIVLALAWIIWPLYGVLWGTLLILHTSGCIGDFALIRYYYKNRRRSMYTYDDVEGERRSYFFETVG